MTPYPDIEYLLGAGLVSEAVEGARLFHAIEKNAVWEANKPLLIKRGKERLSLRASSTIVYRANSESDNQKVDLASLTPPDLGEYEVLNKQAFYELTYNTELNIDPVRRVAIVGEGVSAVMVDLAGRSGEEEPLLNPHTRQIIGALLLMNELDRQVAKEQGVVLAADVSSGATFMPVASELSSVFLPGDGKLEPVFAENYLRTREPDSQLPVVMLHAMAQA